MARNNQQQKSASKTADGGKKNKKSPVVVMKEKPVRVRKHHGQPGVPVYIKKASAFIEAVQPKHEVTKKVERHVVIDGGILDLVALSSVFVGKRHFEVDDLVVQAKPGKQIGTYFSGVRVYFHSAPEGHLLCGMTCSDHFIELDHILLGDVPDNFYKGDQGIRQMCVFLHEADLKAECLREQAVAGPKPEPSTELPTVVETPAEQSAETDKAEPVEISTNMEDVKTGKPGVYDLRRDGSKTGVQIEVSNDGKAVRCNVVNVEGRRFERVAGNAIGFSFTLDQLLGKTLFARHIVDGLTADDVAKNEVIDFLRGLLHIKVEEVVVKNELPKAPPKVVSIETGEAYVAPASKFTADLFRKERSGECEFEGVKLSGSMGWNQREQRERFEVRVLSVPDDHPDCDALRQLNQGNFLATFVVVGQNHYPRETLIPALKSKADGLEALWRLLRRAFSLPDGSALQTADKNPKGKMSA